MKTFRAEDQQPWYDQQGTTQEDRDDMLQDWKILENKISQPRWTAKWTYAAAAMLLLLVSSSLIWMRSQDLTTERCFLQAEKTIILPDGSEVNMVRGSILKYPDNFITSNTRQVSLSGEAVFKVTSDPEHPFIVNTGDAKVRVTGTTFMVSAYQSSKEVEVLVQKGKVLFYNSDTPSPDSFRVGLYAGDVGTYLPRLGQLNKKHLLSTP